MHYDYAILLSRRQRTAYILSQLANNYLAILKTVNQTVATPGELSRRRSLNTVSTVSAYCVRIKDDSVYLCMLVAVNTHT